MIGFTKDILDFLEGKARKAFPGRGKSLSKSKDIDVLSVLEEICVRTFF